MEHSTTSGSILRMERSWASGAYSSEQRMRNGCGLGVAAACGAHLSTPEERSSLKELSLLPKNGGGNERGESDTEILTMVSPKR